MSLRVTDQERIKAHLQKQGHVILALDGLQPDVGHEVLWVVRDCLSEEILLARPLLSSTQGDLTALLMEVKRQLEPLHVPVHGVLSDGEETIRSAVTFVFPGVPHQLCQFHYLKDAIAPFYEADRHTKTLLKKQVRGVRPIERALEEHPTPENLESAFEHFCHLTSNFAAGLFQCYDVEGLPCTNNELEHCFGVTRVHERRATGRRGAIPGVVVRGSVRVMAAVTSKQQRFSQDSVESIERATGQKPVGYNCYWIRDSVNTLDLLQELGFVYHIDDLSHDGPFIQRINGQPFVTVPYTIHLNDIVSFDFPNYTPSEHLQVLKDEFDQLYQEGAHRRRMMVVGTHDRISGRPNRIRVLEEFITYAQTHPGVWFATKKEIAQWALQTPEVTLRAEREKPEISGMPAGHIAMKV